MRLEDLARRAREGDAAALRELWRSRRRWVASVLLAHAPRDADLEDLLQEVALTVVRTISTLREPEAAEAWLRRIAINAARSAGRSRRRRRRVEGGAPVYSPDGPSVEGSIEAREEAERLLGFARDLPEAYREPLLMRCIQGMGYRQISCALGVPVSTVESRLARARRMLRERIEGEGAASAIARRSERGGGTQRGAG
jgi:RNA polymerase sigma-70 factor (ECF subfamily)